MARDQDMPGLGWGDNPTRSHSLISDLPAAIKHELHAIAII
jgi:hypothetical protein